MCLLQITLNLKNIITITEILSIKMGAFYRKKHPKKNT